ncbi:MAG: BLUF domain-containing protein [Natronohydrobacter sp.]|nr:BLUF domain-containing protein [Natronohydrobacter sp.]
MRRIIYLSAARKALDPAEIDEILQISRANNARDGITGLLAYHDGCFFQTVEGPDSKLDALMTRVRRDSRHGNMLILSDKPAIQPAFDGWHMALVQKSELAGLMDDSILPLKALAAQPGKLTEDTTVNALFTSFLRGFRDMVV